MTRLNWMAGFTAALMFAVISATGVARAQDTSSEELVRTNCEYGNTTECGTRTVGTQCSYTWGFNLNIISRLIGGSYSGQKCEGSVQYTLYKDYVKGENNFGVCFAYPDRERAAQDATSVPEDGAYDEAPTC